MKKYLTAAHLLLPEMAPLVSRYRTWVEEQNREQEERWRHECNKGEQAYQKAWQRHEERRNQHTKTHHPWGGLPPFPPRRMDYVPGALNPQQPTYHDFLDWCIREGIQVDDQNGGQ
jgi:hypothetical protein